MPTNAAKEKIPAMKVTCRECLPEEHQVLQMIMSVWPKYLIKCMVGFAFCWMKFHLAFAWCLICISFKRVREWVSDDGLPLFCMFRSSFLFTASWTLSYLPIAQAEWRQSGIGPILGSSYIVLGKCYDYYYHETNGNHPDIVINIIDSHYRWVD